MRRNKVKPLVDPDLVLVILCLDVIMSFPVVHSFQHYEVPIHPIRRLKCTTNRIVYSLNILYWWHPKRLGH